MHFKKEVSLVGTGSYLPEKILTNLDLQKMVDTTDEWIRERTGIIERRIISNGMVTSDMAVEAARKALQNSQISPEEVDLIIVATVSPDHITPSTACYVQHKIGARQIPAFDISAACSGFIYALTVAWNFVASGNYKNVLVIAAEALSTVTDYTDRNTCILFGDGAGAAVLQPGSQAHQILYSTIAADGAGSEMMIIPAGGSYLPASHKTVEERLHYIHLRGREVFKFAVLRIVSLVREILDKCNLTLDDIALIIPHQMNKRILEATAERLGLSMDKIYINIERCGNTSAASIPIALDEASRNGRLKKGDLVALIAFGGGLTWGTTLIKW